MIIPSRDLKFSQKTIESIGHYVYALVDPRDGRIFYIGKGHEERVFEHEIEATTTNNSSIKLDTIRAIKADGMNVQYYILRHGLQESDLKNGEDIAYIIESVFINFLSYSAFLPDTGSNIKNLQVGHHQIDEGIMTVDEVELFYNCPEVTAEQVKKNGHKLLCININTTFLVEHDVYTAVRSAWYLSKETADKCDFVVAEYRGIVRGVYTVRGKWKDSGLRTGKNNQIIRYEFDGDEVHNSPYLNTRITPERNKGNRNPVRYIGVGF